MPITADQCRAARGLLGWNQARLARAAGVSRVTLSTFESGTRTPIPNNLRAIADCLLQAGVEFTPEQGTAGVGVRFRARDRVQQEPRKETSDA
ncbi:transcriptional regulator [Maritimibacter sp. 55A14]|uniref:helix-turn-helix domain-containing protein n=1 Tax=Maritimibacter sp. 55A14 TaxID=2174844 RepID=UPI000D603FE9|nr:helix-turn-helix transcriptional regulator [Maritimibacter sp. 55A14]PWE29988.1 transcriptional regulator [Maritimibacter sp. 55A14]